MTLMTRQIWQMLISQKPPHRGFEFQPVEYEDHIAIRVFLDNLAEYPEQQRQDLAVWIGSLVQKVRDLGCPCEIEGDAKYTTAVLAKRGSTREV